MLEQKVVAITGASSGIGRATALYLAQRGASVVLGARSEEGLAALAEEIKGKGGERKLLRHRCPQTRGPAGVGC